MQTEKIEIIKKIIIVNQETWNGDVKKVFESWTLSFA